MKVLLERFDNPHLAYQTFHIAGTKGKGSTAAFLASVLDTAGYRTGLYTSPHVSDPGERISVSVHLADNNIIDNLVTQIQDVIESSPLDSLPGAYHLTAFELVTLLAFLYFRATECQFAVIETGIGGRYDATNIVQPCACLLTPVELEHTDILGNTIERIAWEKSGIIKPGIPVFSGFQVAEVKNVFQEVCDSKHSTLSFLDEEIDQLSANTGIEGTTFTIRLRGMQEQYFRLRLPGDFQAENASLAYLTLKKMFPQIPDEALKNGLEKAFLPGRMELIQKKPPIMLDGAHTPHAVEKLLSSFRQIFPEKGILIFGAISGKKTREMAKILAPGFREIIISTPGTFKESHPEEVWNIFKKFNGDTILKKNPAEALQEALKASHDEVPILVTGSFFMIAEIRKFFL